MPFDISNDFKFGHDNLVSGHPYSSRGWRGPLSSWVVAAMFYKPINKFEFIGIIIFLIQASQ